MRVRHVPDNDGNPADEATAPPTQAPLPAPDADVGTFAPRGRKARAKDEDIPREETSE